MSKFDREAEDLLRPFCDEAAAVIVVNGLRGTDCSMAIHPMNDDLGYRLKLADA
ncbi:MAG: hypothetical protein J7598_10825 [Mitsuaria chitosanitabida]|uniref:hypothetical protein n=1 Tax=Roseateles chitosanitabidus TaxID=65048 RepID=UPI001B17B505|nr:hypothetical protein [Roseateles chitosanitabidus]MBO9687099.1 hypothetical protein [Roseateles chitosanitabidus]